MLSPGCLRLERAVQRFTDRRVISIVQDDYWSLDLPDELHHAAVTTGMIVRATESTLLDQVPGRNVLVLY